MRTGMDGPGAGRTQGGERGDDGESVGNSLTPVRLLIICKKNSCIPNRLFRFHHLCDKRNRARVYIRGFSYILYFDIVLEL